MCSYVGSQKVIIYVKMYYLFACALVFNSVYSNIIQIHCATGLYSTVIYNNNYNGKLIINKTFKYNTVIYYCIYNILETKKSNNEKQKQRQIKKWQ